MSKGHVFIIEDDESLAGSLVDILHFSGYVARRWPQASRFLEAIPDAAPAVVLTDMRMPGLSGVQLHEALLARGREMPVIYVSGESTVQQSVSAMKLGAVDFLLKPFSREQLLQAVAEGVRRDRERVEALRARAQREDALGQLSPRESEVLGLLLQGFSNAEIVDALGVALPTAKQYKSEVMRKLDVRSLSQLMREYASAARAPEAGAA